MRELFGILLVLTGILDALKYSIQAVKVAKQHSSKAMSRKFMVMALSNDLVKIVYSVLIWDVYIFISSVLALGCMLHLWWNVYYFYPYKQRGLANFKRPNIFYFTWNACIPNSIRPRL